MDAPNGAEAPSSDSGVPVDSDAQEIDTDRVAAFKAKFGKDAHLGVPAAKPKPVEPSYMDTVKEAAKALSYFPRVDIGRAVGQPPDTVRNMGAFVQSDVGGHNAPPNPFSAAGDKVPYSPGTVDNTFPLMGPNGKFTR